MLTSTLVVIGILATTIVAMLKEQKRKNSEIDELKTSVCRLEQLKDSLTDEVNALTKQLLKNNIEPEVKRRGSSTLM